MPFVTTQNRITGKIKKIRIPDSDVFKKFRIYNYRFMINKSSYEPNDSLKNKFVCTHCSTGSEVSIHHENVLGCINEMKTIKKQYNKQDFQRAIETIKKERKNNE